MVGESPGVRFPGKARRQIGADERDLEKGSAMKSYTVVWSMEIDADTPQGAAEKALAIHRDPESIATVFEVDGVKVDLTFPDDDGLADDLRLIRKWNDDES